MMRVVTLVAPGGSGKRRLALQGIEDDRECEQWGATHDVVIVALLTH